MTEMEALATLNAWFASHESDVSNSTLDTWNIWPYRDAWGFTPAGGQRTNRLYMVRDLTVVSYAPTSETDEEAYARLRTDPNPPGLAEPKPILIRGALPDDLEDGIVYYLEQGTPSFDLSAMVYRVTITDGLRHVTHWDVETERWVPSRRLIPYGTGRGENRLYSATPQEAERWRQHRQSLWAKANTPAATPTAGGATQRVNAFLEELRSFPGWSGISFRGMSTEAEFGQTANVAVSRGLVATSRDSRVATENFSTPGVYAILGTEGRGIESVSRYPKEFEVLFLPGTTFAVIDKIEVDGYPVTLVRQAKLSADTPPIDIDDFTTRARNAIADGRGGSQAAITSHGKYVGDID